MSTVCYFGWCPNLTHAVSAIMQPSRNDASASAKPAHRRHPVPKRQRTTASKDASKIACNQCANSNKWLQNPCNSIPRSHMAICSSTATHKEPYPQNARPRRHTLTPATLTPPLRHSTCRAPIVRRSAYWPCPSSQMSVPISFSACQRCNFFVVPIAMPAMLAGNQVGQQAKRGVVLTVRC